MGHPAKRTPSEANGGIWVTSGKAKWNFPEKTKFRGKTDSVH